jgi:hypothetical protein
MILKKMELECVDWTAMARDRDRLPSLVRTVMDLRVPSKARNFLTC